MNIVFLQSFYHVVETGSFSKAALRLSVPKSRVSRYISSLEAELNQQLFYRTTRTLELTPYGSRLHEACREGFANIETRTAGLTRESTRLSGVIRMTVPDDIGIFILNSIIASFCNVYPLVKFEVFYTSTVLDVFSESIDIALRVGKSKQKSLVIRKVGEISFVLVASPKFLQRFPEAANIQRLNSDHFLDFGPKDVRTPTTLTHGTETIKISSTAQFTCRSMLGLAEFAALGFGVALVPRFTCQHLLRRGELVEVSPGWTIKKPSVYLTLHSHNAKVQIIKRFCDYAAPKLATQLA